MTPTTCSPSKISTRSKTTTDHSPKEAGCSCTQAGTPADPEAFLNATDGNPHSPGLTPSACWIAEEKPSSAWGSKPSASTRAPQEGSIPFPAHYYLKGANKYGVTQLANLGALPPTGTLLLVAPLKLTGGTGSPVRVFALVPEYKPVLGERAKPEVSKRQQVSGDRNQVLSLLKPGNL